MDFPLHLTFKTFALTHQASVTDAEGHLVLYVKQKAFTWKDTFTVFADAEQTQPLYTLRADRVMHFSASFLVTDAQGQVLGSVRRHGRRSLWRAHYEVVRDEQVLFDIREVSPWVKVMDGLFGEIPLLGIFSGYVFHPAYQATRADGTPALRLEKKPAFLGGKFDIVKQAQLSPTEEGLGTLGLLVLTMLERRRG